MLGRMFVIAMLVTVGVFAMLSTPLLAHHGTATWSDKEISMKGTVVEYLWKNPHVLIVWNVTDESGKTVQWTGEVASPESMMSDDGWREETFRSGEVVTCTVRPSMFGSPDGLIDQIKNTARTM